MIARSILPLGALAPAPGTVWDASSIDRTAVLLGPVRSQVVRYLRGCPLFLAWMEYTRDEIGGKFDVAGGSGIQSDGVYYWRVDASEYVREYGIGIPASAINHFEAMEWVPPKFDHGEYIEIFEHLDHIVGTGVAEC